jgi:hypothetical protein
MTFIQLRDAAIIVIAALGLIVLMGNVFKTFKEWKKPKDDLQKWRDDVDKKLTSDNDRLEVLESGNRVICRGILAMLSHDINGNSIDKLVASQTEITNYLIDK